LKERYKGGEEEEENDSSNWSNWMTVRKREDA